VALYRAPDSFSTDRGETAADRPITITAGAKSLSVTLVRPPVLLVHGLWSGPGTWGKEFLAELEKRGLRTYKANYKADSMKSFDPADADAGGMLEVKGRVAVALAEFRDAGIAASKVDVIAHSMGGLMTRSFIQQPGYQHPGNYYEGSIHRLITIGTPHDGTPIANFLWDNRDLDFHVPDDLPFGGKVQSLRSVMAWMGKIIDTAVQDLREGSGAFSNMRATHVWGHAITGEWGPGVGNLVVKEGFEELITQVNRATSWRAKWFERLSLEDIYGSHLHDLIVPVSSQRAGFKGVGAVTSRTDTIHTALPYTPEAETETESAFIGYDCGELLTAFLPEQWVGVIDAPDAVANVSSGLMARATRAENRAVAPAPGEALRLVSPAGETITDTPGRTITLKASYSGPSAPARVVFMVQDVGIFAASAPGYTITVAIPPGTPLGRLNVVVLGTNSAGAALAAQSSLTFAPAAPPLSLTAEPVALTLIPGQHAALIVKGNFEGSSEARDVTQSNTTYTTAKAGAVVTVAADGVVTGVAAGEDIITVTHQGVVTQIPVRVANIATSPLPTLSLSATTLNFGAVSGHGTLPTVTPAQAIRLLQAGTGVVSWTATADQPWITVSPASGTGAAILTVSVNNTGNILPSSGARAGTITVTANGASNSPSATVNLTLVAGTTASPFGSFDTPLDNTTGVTGSIAVTGWALDDLGVTRVRILRDPVPGEGSALVFIGNAVLVEGARPDVAAAFSALPFNRRAGWGYLMLTNFLPNEGNGTFRLHAYADDVEGRSTLLGSRTIAVANSSATMPFGAIDTPGQGETVSGTVNNFGWVLAPGARRADVPGGGTVDVFVDGVRVGSPTGWSSRSDLSALFPASRYHGIGSALAVFTFDTTTLGDGVHTIAWGVTDNHGGAAGVGSRHFTVANGSGATIVAAANAAGSSSANVLPIAARRGFDAATPMQAIGPDAAGRVTIDGEELDRLELQVPGVTSGRLTAADGASALPIGSTLDVASETFTWQPGAGFVGTYDLAFDTAHGPRAVRIVLHPKGSGRVGSQVVVDAPRPHQTYDGAFTLGGWAADLDAAIGTGIDTVHVWAYPVGGDPPVFVAVAAYGGLRPDVAAIHGDQFRESGYSVMVNDLAPGSYDLAVFGFSTVRGGFLPAKTVRVTIR
jgi:hypothetical protein